MNKKIIFLLSFLFLSSCSTTYNNREYKILTNIKNYNRYEVKFHSINQADNDITRLNVTFINYMDLSAFVTFEVNEETNLSVYPISFTIFKDNYENLNSSSFFNIIKLDDELTIYASNCKRFDGTYKFLLSVEYNDYIYLSQEDGMNGIKTYLNEHRSPFFQ